MSDDPFAEFEFVLSQEPNTSTTFGGELALPPKPTTLQVRHFGRVVFEMTGRSVEFYPDAIHVLRTIMERANDERWATADLTAQEQEPQ